MEHTTRTRLAAAAATVLGLTTMLGTTTGSAVAAPAAEPTQVNHEFMQTSCLEVAHQGRAEVCASRTVFQARNGDWVQTDAHLWVRNCSVFESPVQARIYRYGVWGVNRAGHIVTYNTRQDDFNLNGCSNYDHTNYRNSQPCFLTTFHGNAHIDWAANREFLVRGLMSGPCATPDNVRGLTAAAVAPSLAKKG